MSSNGKVDSAHVFGAVGAASPAMVKALMTTMLNDPLNVAIGAVRKMQVRCTPL